MKEGWLYPIATRYRREEHEFNPFAIKEGINREKHLRGAKGGWTVYDSALEEGIGQKNSFDKSFRPVLPENTSLRSYVEDHVLRSGVSALGIEFGGPGSNLFAGFTQGVFKRSLGVTLVDKRGKAKRIRDEGRHTVIAGDLQREDVQKDVVRWTNGEKVDVIFERMIGGLEYFPKDPYHMIKIADFWYSLLSGHGVMFLQVPYILNSLLSPWLDLIKIEYPQRLEVVTNGVGRRYSSSVLRLNKADDAPEHLPVLSPWVVRKAYSDMRLDWFKPGD